MASSSDSVKRVEQVTSTGTSWIICRSKSHSGRIYYFNTLTGEATWNLSEAEMERARNSSKRILSQEDSNIIACPEPSEPPEDKHPRESPTRTHNPSTSRPIPSTARIYNKQVINNQYGRLQFPISPIIVPGCNVVQNMVQNPVNHLYPITASTSSSVWAVPPQQQIVINSNCPLVTQTQPVQVDSQGQPPPNFHFNDQGQNVPFHSRFKSFRKRSHPSHLRRRKSCDAPPLCDVVTPARVRRRKSVDATTRNNKKCYKDNNFDLRLLLSAKKNRRKMYHPDYLIEQEQDNNWNSERRKEHDTAVDEGAPSENEGPEGAHSEQPTHKDEHMDADEDWIEENFFVEQGKIKLNVATLKKLAQVPQVDMDPLDWYIVADTDVLLHHLNFLNILINSDEACRLLVPQGIVAELQTYRESASRRIANRAKRAVVFLMQHSDNINVAIGGPSYGETDTKCDYLLKCCRNLREDNYHVVLLSNDDGFKKVKDSDIPTLSIMELKQVLTNPEQVEDKKKYRLKPPPWLTTKRIVITGSNNLTNSEDHNRQKITISLSKKTQNTEKIKCVDYSSLSKTSDTTKHISESEVRLGGAENEAHATEDTPNKTNNEVSPRTSSQSNDIRTISSDNSKTASSTINQNRLIKREIRLNRSTSVKPLVNAEETPGTEEKRQFRWRKKRLTHDRDRSLTDESRGSCSNDGQLSSAVSSNVGENRDVTPIKDVLTSTNNYLKLQQTLVSEESYLSDISSCKYRNTTKGNVTIEETSTSEIISASESGDQPARRFVEDQSRTQEQSMFKVMEDSSQEMNDEWLSRFWQIMEEALTQILRHDEEFLNQVVYAHYGGGPWTIQEATECMKIKFKDHPEVVNAANELSSKLSEVSDSTGRINVDSLSTFNFMELFSYGVNLVHNLVPILGTCEDLLTASSSLTALIEDIKGPNLDLSHNDTFIDCTRPVTPPSDRTYALAHASQNLKILEKATAAIEKETAAIEKKTAAIEKEAATIEKEAATIEKEAAGTENQTAGTENQTAALEETSCKRVLRSAFKTPAKLPEKKIQQKKPKRTISKRKFALSLNLVENIPNSNCATTDISKADPTNAQDVKTVGTIENSSEPLPSLENTDLNVVTQSAEEKMDRISFTRESLDMDHLDYSGYDDDQGSHRFDEGDSAYFDFDKAQSIILAETKGNGFAEDHGGDNFDLDSPLYLNSALNCIFKQVTEMVKESIMEIRRFCDRITEELSGPVYTTQRKSKLHEQAKNAQSQINNLCEAITRDILYDPENNIPELLQDAGIQCSKIDVKLLDEYRVVMGTCCEHAKILQESMADLITVIEIRPTTS